MLAHAIMEDFNACTGMPRKVVFPMGPATLAKQKTSHVAQSMNMAYTIQLESATQ